MPEIPMESENWSELLLRTMALWIDPADSSRYSQIESNLIGHFMQAAVTEFGVDTIKPSAEDITHIHRARPEILVNRKEEDQLLPNVGIPAFILTYVLRCAVHHIEFASIRKVFPLVVQTAEKEGWPKSRKYIQGVWSRNRPFAHFCAAAFLKADIFTEIGNLVSHLYVYENDEKRPSSIKVSKEGIREVANDVNAAKKSLAWADTRLPELFAMAERLRELGERHYPLGHKKRATPLLDPAETWKVPKNMALPHIELNLEPLSDEELDIIRTESWPT